MRTMAMCTEDGEEIYRFGAFKLAARSGLLQHNDTRIALTPKALQTLIVLLRNPNRVVEQERLLAEVWPDLYVSPSGLTRNISVLRKALQDAEPGATFIETIPKYGYRFVHPVERETSTPTPSLPEPAAAVSTGRWRIPYRHWIAAALMLVAAAVWQLRSRTETLAPEQALQQYRLAVHLLRQVTPQQVQKSVRLLEDSVQQYPHVAITHAGLANALITDVELGSDDPHPKLVKARMAAVRATQLNPTLEQARIVSGLATLLADWDWNSAETELRRAMALHPSSAPAHQTYAYFLLKAGRIEEAVQAIERAAQLDPVSPMIGAQQAHTYYAARLFEDAVRAAESVLDREPSFALARYYLSLSLAHLGSHERALAELERTNFHPKLIEIDRAWILAHSGNLEAARTLADSLTPPQAIVLRVALGQLPVAVSGIEQLIAQRSPDALNLLAEPRLHALRANASYQQLRQRLGL